MHFPEWLAPINSAHYSLDNNSGYDNQSQNADHKISLISKRWQTLIQQRAKISTKKKTFMQNGCGCILSGKGGQCCEQFSEETVLFNLNNCQELSHGELDLVILTSIQGFTRSDPVGGKRNRSPQSSFFFQSKPICKDMFLHFFLFQAFLLNYVEENTITLLRQK